MFYTFFFKLSVIHNFENPLKKLILISINMYFNKNKNININSDTEVNKN